jgi:4-hydroxyphenylpyruvate dioxygenase
MNSQNTMLNEENRHGQEHKKNIAAAFRQIDYVELYVGNAFQTAHFFRAVLGFEIAAYQDLTTGSKDIVSYLVRQGDIRLLFTSAGDASSTVSRHVQVHGDGVKDIAFATSNVAETFGMAVEAGAVPVTKPVTHEDAHGQITSASISTFGDTVHSLVERRTGQTGTDSFYLPGYRPYTCVEEKTAGTGLEHIDHFAVCLEQGQLQKWCDFYKNSLGFYSSHKEDIYTEYSGMNSEVVRLDPDSIKFAMIEPGPGKKKSQVQEFLNYYQGEGVQHIAFLTHDIIESVRTLKKRGIEFLTIPATYYEALEKRVGDIEEELPGLQESGVLVDRDHKGYLLQVFSKPIQARPTFFIEVIQRKGAVGFGSGNIKALFEAIEKEQRLRGNL